MRLKSAHNTKQFVKRIVKKITVVLLFIKSESIKYSATARIMAL